MPDLLRKASSGTRAVAANLSDPFTELSTSANLNVVTGWNTDTEVDVIMYQVDATNELIEGTQTDWVALLSGNTLSNMVLRAGVVPEGGYPSGTLTVVECAPTAAWCNDLVTALMEHTNQDGTLKTEAVQEALSLGTDDLAGWNPLGFTPSSVTHNGNRSYDFVFSGENLSTTLSPGMRLRLARTVNAPVQCASLATNQYLSKAAPNGMIFTDDFAAGAWIKLSSYAGGGIVSRYNGTSGWVMYVDPSSGRLLLQAYNAGSSNTSYVISTQSVPLNRWVHVAAQLDMSSFSATPTTSYILFDGVDIPATVVRGGTNPVALIQAGNLEIGSWNGGSNSLNGKVAQVAVFGAKVTQATMRSYMGQGYTGTETSLVSAYSLSNSLVDLTVNANNLTANNGATTANADSPFGTQIDGTISPTLEYGIVSKVVFSTNTTVTLQIAEGCMAPTSGGISSIVYSSQDVPYNFPKHKDRWRIVSRWTVTFTTTSTTFVVSGKELNVPLGSWNVGYSIDLLANSGDSPHDDSVRSALSAVAATADDADLVAFVQWYITGISGSTVSKEKSKLLTAATKFYMNYAATVSIQVIAGAGNDLIYADNGYL